MTSATARGQKDSKKDKVMKTTITFFALTAEQLVDNEWKQVYYMYENTVVYEAEKAKRFDTLDEAREFHASIKPSKYTKNEQIQKIQLTIDVKETFSVGAVDTFTKIKQMLAKGGFRKDYTTKEAGPPGTAVLLLPAFSGFQASFQALQNPLFFQ